MLQLGQWELHTVDGGQFWLDAGVMYGMIPKTVWQNVSPPDAMNRIPLGIHCVLARNKDVTVLIDTGYGGKLSPLERSSYVIEAGDPILASLATLGVSPRDIDIVAFSHLHWDHSGGATRFGADRQPVPTFPNATHFVNRQEWEDANSGSPDLGGYTPQDFLALDSFGQLVLIDGETEVVPGLRTRPTGGHTRGHQAFIFESEGQVALYPGDLCPIVNHLRRLWSSAYEIYPLEIRSRKVEFLGEAADRGWWILWDHDPTVALSRLQRHKTRDFVITDARGVL